MANIDTLRKILSNDLVAKWVNLRDYALDTLYSKSDIANLMDEIDKYEYGEWVKNSGTWGAKGNVPIMTANNAPYSVIEGSSYYTGQPYFYAFDGNSNTAWVLAAGQGTGFINITLVNPLCAKRIKYRSDNARVTSIEIQGWNTGGTIQSLGKFTPSGTGDQFFNLVNNNYFNHYSLVIRAISDDLPHINTIQFYGRELSVKQASAPTDGRKYVQIGSDYYTEDWGEKEFATNSNRLTIYDHGVELVELVNAKDNGWSAGDFVFTNNVVKGTNDISIGYPTASQTLTMLATKNAINLSSYNYSKYGLQARSPKATTNTIVMAVNSAKNTSSTYTISALTISKGNTRNYINISSVKQSVFFTVYSVNGYHGDGYIDELWLE